MLNVGGKPLIEILLHRLSQSKKISQIIVATSSDSINDGMASFVAQLGYDVFRGSEEDVLDRYYLAAKENHAKVVVRVTGDCPLIDPEIVDSVIECFHDTQVDYASNINPPTFPDGLDVEVFSFDTLEQAWQETTQKHYREHVTPYMREEPKYKKSNVSHEQDLSRERWTVDDPEDFEVVSRIFEHFSPNQKF